VLRSPLSDDLVGAAVFEDDRVLGVAWDTDRVAAQRRATGEAYERWALFDAKEAAVVAPAVELGDAAIDLIGAARPPDRVLADERFHAFRWNDGLPTSWVAAQRGHSGVAVLVPLDLSRFRGEGADPVRIRPMSSVGTATALTAEDAQERALLEVIERHVVATAVRDHIPATTCDGQSEAADLAAALEPIGLRLDVGLLPNPFGVAVAVAAVSRDRDGDPSIPAASFGSGAALKGADALRSAALEAVQVLHLGLQLLRRTQARTTIVSGHDRARAWAAWPTPAPAADFFSGRRSEALEAPRASSICRCFVEAGVTWWHRDITPAWADGWAVVRVGAPSLGQLLPDERAPIVLPPDDQGGVELAEDEWERVRSHPFV